MNDEEFRDQLVLAMIASDVAGTPEEVFAEAQSYVDERTRLAEVEAASKKLQKSL